LIGARNKNSLLQGNHQTIGQTTARSPVGTNLQPTKNQPALRTCSRSFHGVHKAANCHNPGACRSPCWRAWARRATTSVAVCCLASTAFAGQRTPWKDR